MSLTLDQKIAIGGVAVASVAAIAGWLALPIRKWRKGLRLFLLQRLTPTSPRAEDFPGIRKADSKILEEILVSLPSTLIEWLHDQDFGNGFWNTKLSPLLDFNWKHKGPEFEFLDYETESLRLVLLGEIQEFTNLIAAYTVWGKDGWQKIPDQHDSGQWTEASDARFHQKRWEINNAAERVRDSYKRLIRTARVKLALSDPGEVDNT